MRRLACLWISIALVVSCHAGDAAALLEGIVGEAGPGKVVVFDLDDTLFLSGGRSFRIMKDFAREKTTRARFPRISRHVTEVLERRHVVYFLRDSLANIGVAPEDVARYEPGLRQYWNKRFFTNAQVLRDEPVPGSVEYVNRVHDTGATVVYLTGRDVARMGLGTRKALRNAGFPLGDRAILFLKPDLHIEDIDYKKEAYGEIAKIGKVTAFFENEPKNLVAAMEPGVFPGVTGVFLDTVNSGKMHLMMGRADIHWIPDYRAAQGR